MLFCSEALESTKISSYEPVSSQKYENGYRTKICNFTFHKRLIISGIFFIILPLKGIFLSPQFEREKSNKGSREERT